MEVERSQPLVAGAASGAPTRRRFLLGLGAAASAGWVLAGCGGASGDGAGVDAGPTGADADLGPDGWAPGTLYFYAGRGGTVALASSLPSGARPGGVFAVDPGGAALPAGMTLSADGTLAVGSAAVGTSDGVIFTYDEP